MNKYMFVAIEEARNGLKNKDGGPFGAVIVKDGKIVGKGHNCVISKKNPILHGEMVAITDACKNLDTFDLKGCEIYTTGQPCPMCLGAILWANIEKVHYGFSILDANNIGFRDNVFYEKLKDRSDFLFEVDKEECLKLCEEYNQVKEEIKY